MNLLLLLKGTLLGGAEKDVMRLARGLEERGHRVRVGAEGAPMLEAVRAAGLRSEPLPAARLANARLGVPGAIARICRRHEIDLINAHSIGTAAQAGLVSRLGRRRIPVIATVHNIHDRRNDALAYLVLRYLVDEVVFVSRYERDRLGRRFRRGLGRVLPSGIELPEPQTVVPVDLAARHGIPRGAPVIGFVGRLATAKGVEDAIAALELLPSEARLCIVGAGPQEGALRAQVARGGLQDRVIFAGWRPDVEAYLRSFSLLVLPSRREALPVVLREAAALERPVVAADVGGVREIVEHGSTGLLYAAGDVGALAEAIGTLLAQPERAREMGRRARRVVAERFGLKRWLEETESLFRAACR